jgi:hypothetical protein
MISFHNFVHDILRCATAFGALGTAFSACMAWRQLRVLRKQAASTFEDRLTEQYRKIMRRIPVDIRFGLDLDELDKTDLEGYRGAIFSYIDLCNEQAFLRSKKKISKEVWAEWEPGIVRNMKLPAFSSFWAQVKDKCPDSFQELRKIAP